MIFLWTNQSLYDAKKSEANLTKISSCSFYSSKSTLVFSRMSYEIAEDMYRNSLGINRCFSEMLCMSLFLCCVELFSRTRENLASSIDKDVTVEKSMQGVDTRKIVQPVLTKTQNWLRRNYSFWYNYTNDCLNVSIK